MDQKTMNKAEHAARLAIRRLEVQLSSMDIEDVEQTAALAFWRAWEKRPDLDEDSRTGYAFAAARNEAVKFIIRTLFGDNPFEGPALEDVDYFLTGQRTGQRGPLSNEALGKLFKIFLDSRKKQGRRGMKAAARDVFIVNALAQEWNNAGIGAALGQAPGNIKKYRYRIRRVLREELEKRKG